MIQPALTPLHPEKPPREIVPGETWTTKASGKNSPSRPRVVVFSHRGKLVTHTPDPSRGPFQTQLERTFRRDYQ